MIENPRAGMLVRLGSVGLYSGAIVTLIGPESPNEWWFEFSPDHEMAKYGQKSALTLRMHPIPVPPKFTSPEEADAWMDANA